MEALALVEMKEKEDNRMVGEARKSDDEQPMTASSVPVAPAADEEMDVGPESTAASGMNAEEIIEYYVPSYPSSVALFDDIPPDNSSSWALFPLPDARIRQTRGYFDVLDVGVFQDIDPE